MKSLSCVQLLATPWTAAYQARPPMGFSRQILEYWSGMPLPSLELLSRICKTLKINEGGFPGGTVLKNLPANTGDEVSFLGQEDPLEKEMARHSIIPAWEIPWTEEPGG